MKWCRVFHFVLENKEKKGIWNQELRSAVFFCASPTSLKGGGGASSSTFMAAKFKIQEEFIKKFHKEKGLKVLKLFKRTADQTAIFKLLWKSQEKTRRKLFILQLPMGSLQSNARVGFSLDLIGYKCPADYTSFAGEAKWSRRGGGAEEGYRVGGFSHAEEETCCLGNTCHWCVIPPWNWNRSYCESNWKSTLNYMKLITKTSTINQITNLSRFLFSHKSRYEMNGWIHFLHQTEPRWEWMRKKYRLNYLFQTILFFSTCILFSRFYRLLVKYDCLASRYFIDFLVSLIRFL